MTDREAYLILNLVSGIGPVRVNALIEFCGSPAAIFEHEEGDLARIHGVSESLAHKILSPRNLELLEHEFAIADQGGVRITTPADDDYPQAFREIHDPPLALYIRGVIPPEISQRSLAMVGTRNVSHYGTEMARHLAESAAYAGWVTVSGLACGIDTIVHRATVDAGGKTVGILGGGLARFHPQENLPLARDIINSGGAVISEFPMTFSPTRHSFPMRNRLISALSLGTLVIEAGTNSGSLITAAHALEQGRRIFAVPGPADASGANGCNALIRKGAVLVENFDHILEEFDFLPGFEHGGSLSLREEEESASSEDDSVPDQELFGDGLLSGIDEEILSYLRKNGDTTSDQLTNTLDHPAPDILASLTALEILSRIRRNPNGTYHRIR